MGINDQLLSGNNIWKEYSSGEQESLVVLKGVHLTISRGEVVVIVGPSGAGKSTLLHILGGLDRPTKGEVWFNGKNIFLYNEDELAHHRNKSIGFVFQFHHLLPEFTAVENVAMPAMLSGESLSSSRKKAEALLQEVGLGDRLNHKPNELSGGEQQRVAVARALVNDPLLVLADEPSGNLDEETGKKLHELLINIAQKRAVTFIIATHNPDLANRAERTIRIVNGIIQ